MNKSENSLNIMEDNYIQRDIGMFKEKIISLRIMFSISFTDAV